MEESCMDRVRMPLPVNFVGPVTSRRRIVVGYLFGQRQQLTRSSISNSSEDAGLIAPSEPYCLLSCLWMQFDSLSFGSGLAIAAASCPYFGSDRQLACYFVRQIG